MNGRGDGGGVGQLKVLQSHGHQVLSSGVIMTKAMPAMQQPSAFAPSLSDCGREDFLVSSV